MTSLRHLSVYNNKLKGLPLQIEKLAQQLHTFDAGRNPFDTLPDKWGAST